LKKITLILVFLILLSAGAWIFLRFAPPQLFRDVSFSTSVPTAETPSKDSALITQYQQWRDSIDALDLAIRAETDPRMIKLHKERQQYFWRKLNLARRSLPISRDSQESAQSQQARSENTQDLIRLLSRVLSITAAILVFLIIILLILLKRKKDALTRQLASLQEDERFKAPRSGFAAKDSHEEQDLTAPIAVQSPRRRAEKTSRPSPNTIPPTGAIPNRPTARQRVTNALKGLAEALATLKDDHTPPLSRDQNKVRSQNSASPIPDPSVLQPSRYDREQEIKSEILRLTRRGFTSSEIARRLRVPQDQVETVIRLQRDNGA